MRMRNAAPPLPQEQQQRSERMNLSSHLEYQNDTFEDDDQPSQLQKERHELPALPKANKNSAGVINCCLGCVFVVVICFSLITLSVFAVGDNSVKVAMNNNYNTSGCVLFGFYNRTYDPPLQFGNSKTCMFVIWGMAGISFINLLYLCGACFRALLGLVCGLSAFTFLLVVDVVVFVFITLISLSIGSVLHLGRVATCEAVKDTYPNAVQDQVKNCSTDFITINNGQVSFDSLLHVSEVSCWSTSGILAFITLVHIGLLCVYLLKCYRKRNTISEEELSPFNVDDDEPMLDASAPYNPEQTSFPPYNVGGPNYPNGNEPMMSYNTPGEDFWNSS